MQGLLLALIRAYRYILSPWVGQQCRFTPTCSVYAMQAIEAYGSVRGSWLAAKRLLRCHPLCRGGHDPVPGLDPDPPFDPPAAATEPDADLQHHDQADAGKRQNDA